GGPRDSRGGSCRPHERGRGGTRDERDDVRFASRGDRPRLGGQSRLRNRDVPRGRHPRGASSGPRREAALPLNPVRREAIRGAPRYLDMGPFSMVTKVVTRASAAGYKRDSKRAIERTALRATPPGMVATATGM